MDKNDWWDWWHWLNGKNFVAIYDWFIIDSSDFRNKDEIPDEVLESVLLDEERENTRKTVIENRVEAAIRHKTIKTKPTLDEVLEEMEKTESLIIHLNDEVIILNGS